MEPINWFNATAYLEPRCKCGIKITYDDATTRWDTKRQSLVCNGCGILVLTESPTTITAFEQKRAALARDAM